VRDVDSFYAACDVMAVPSVFDPSPMVVLESISRGVPVIATAGVGNLKHLLRTGAGAEWTEAELLGNIARDMVAHRERYLTGGAKMVEELSEERRAVRLLETYSLSLAAHGATGN
jgi:glycosyltransferase involved in cell wall biosynthesis